MFAEVGYIRLQFPVIHDEIPRALRFRMDGRVEPGHDEGDGA